MKNRKRGHRYSSVVVATTEGGSDSGNDSDEDAIVARGTHSVAVPLQRLRRKTGTKGSDDSGNDDDDDFNDDDDDDGDGGDEESGLEDDDRLNRQLDFEVAEILKLNESLDTRSRQSKYCLGRCFCGTKNARVMSVWFFTFLIFGVVEIVGSLKVGWLVRRWGSNK